MPVRRPSFLPIARLLRPSLCAIGLLLAASTEAATYYVATNGSDASANPTNPATPWQTVAKVKAAALNPGDQVLFRRGDTWAGALGGTLVPSASGAPGNPIVFGAYGSGAKPIFDGTGLSGNGMTISEKSHLQVLDLDFRKSPGQGVQILFCDYITVRGVDVSDNGSNAGILARGGSNIHIDGCIVTNARSNGILFGGSEFNKIRDSIIENCTVNGTRANDGIVIHMQQIIVDGVTVAWHSAGENFIIRNNTATGCVEQGYDITTGGHVLLENNRSSRNNAGGVVIGHTAHNVTLRYHRSDNEPTANTASTLKISVPNVLVEYSSFLGSAHVKPVLQIGTSSNPGDHQADNVVIRNNTFVWNSLSNGQIFDLQAGVEMTTFRVYNNIFASRTPAQITLRYQNAARPPGYSGYDIDHNLYYSSGGVRWTVGSTGGITFPNYRAIYARDLYGLEANPLLVDVAGGNYRLQTGSPALDAGASDGLTLDLDGQPVPQGAGRDLGAYEGTFVGGAQPPLAPSNLIATPVSSTQVNLAWIDHATDETQFRIERSIGAGTFGLLSTKGANATSHIDATATDGTSYKYRVLAENANGQSAWSNEAAATTPGEVPLNFDFNALPIAASSGDPRASPSFTGASGGNFLRYQSNQLGDFITFNVNVPVARQYHIAVRYHMNFQRGITQLFVDGAPLGAARNLYSQTGMLQTFNLGSRFLSAGVHQFRFEVVGNWNTTAGDPTWEIGLDLLTLTPGDSGPPVLTLPEDFVLEATSAAGAVATFSAAAHDNVDGAVPIALSHASGSTFPLGTTLVSAVASDGAGNTATGSFSVTVVDTTAPDLTVPEEDIEVEATSDAGSVVTFGVSATDLVDAAVTLVLSHSSGTVFPFGATTVTATATDTSGNTSTANFTVTVKDTAAPVIQSLSASPAILWPVNQRMISVHIGASVADAADSAPTTRIASVTCNEPIRNGASDWEITGPLTLNLRADRNGTDAGRIYFITVRSTDAAGNSSQSVIEVSVPHDQRP